MAAGVLVGGVLQGTGVAQASVAAPAASPKAKAAAVTQNSDLVSAKMAARKQKTRVEVLGDRTPYAQTFANPDGTLTYVSSAAPRWVKQGSGWVGVDATLVRGQDGSYSPKAAEAGLTLSGGGSGALATVDAGGGRTLSVSWPSALPVPSVSGAVATYADVLPGVDLVLTATVTGAFEETLVIRDAAAAKDPGLADLQLKVGLGKGLSQSVDKAGNVTVKDAKGAAVFSSPAPSAWDSATAAGALASSVRGPGRGAHAAKVQATYSTGAVRMSVPGSLLTGKGIEFPLFVDPSYTVTQSWEGYDEAQSAYPTTDELNATYNGNVSVGYDGAGIDRGYYVLGLPSAADGGTTDVLSATLSTQAVVTYTAASTSHTVNAYYTSQVADATTWNNPPTQLAGPSATTFTTASTAPNQTVNFDVSSYVQTDLDAYGWQFSAELANSSETDGTKFVEFANNPTLTINYDHAPWSPGTMALSPQSWASNGSLYTSSLTPTLQASTTDDDGDQIAYQFKVQQGTTVVATGTSGYYASGATGSWAVPSALTDLTTYQMYVRGYDGTEYGSWSSAYNFTTDAAAAPVPTVSCSGYPSGTWSALVSGGTTCSVTDTSSYISGYSYEYIEGSNYNNPTWGWASGASATITIDPQSPGLYYLVLFAYSDGGLETYAPWYSFGVGATGAMLSPTDGSQTSSAVTLQAAVPGAYTKATYEYRYGTSGSFTAIPDHVVYDCACPVTWPVSTTTNSAGVQTDALTWYMNRTLSDDGPVQVEAVFADASGNTLTTPPVTVSLDRLGSGADYGTTSAGPVTVGLQSGNAALSATDVSIASYGASLSVSRTFNSVAPSTASIFGPGWASSIAAGSTSSWASVTDDSSYVLLTSGDGSTYDFAAGSTTSGVTSYSGDGAATTAGLTLTKNTSANTFSLTQSSGSTTSFAVNAASSTLYSPSTITTPGTSSTAGYVYDSTGRPLLVVGPDAASSSASTTACPSPASATTWTSAGCRGLKFSYDATTGHVSEIDFVYVDNAGTFHSVAVADYTYDTLGKLASQWDPRLSTPLKNTYTYDETSTDADYGRITQISPAQAASSGALAPWTLTYDDTAGDVNYGKVLTVSRTHSSTYGGATATTTIGYSVPLTTAAGGPLNMDSATVATWAQADDPTSAVAVWSPAHVPSSTTSPTATDYEYASINYYDASGRQVNEATYINGAWAVSTTEYDAYGNETRELTAANRATALASSSPAATSQQLDTESLYACDNFGTIAACTSATQKYQVLTDTYGPAHTANVDGTSETIRAHTAYAYDASAPNSDTNASGTPYLLKTSQIVSASVGSAVPATSTADARTTQYVYANGSDNLGWTLGSPLKTITDPSGLAITKTTVYNESSALYGGDNLTTDTYQPATTTGGTAGDTKSVYYTAGTNSVDSSCGNQPAWANLVCKTEPAAQPADTATIPTTTYTYNAYLSTLTKVEAYGTTGTRTTTYAYDAADRQSTRTIAVSGTGMGTAVPETKTVYSSADGLDTDTETLNSSGAATSDLVSVYDDFGQEISYTDASGTTSTSSYDLDGRPVSRYDGQGTDTISYSPGGQAVTEVDSLAGTFSATYNADGGLLTKSYPDGTVGTYTVDPTGTATSLVYTNGNWASSIADTVAVNSQGDWTGQSVLNASYTYAYDAADRLTSAADTQAGSCTTRAYTYDADSNRTGLTSYAPASGGTCQTSSGTAETYSYDTADRLTSTTTSGTVSTYAYSTQGAVTTTPSADAGGTGALTSAYYADDMLAGQTQAGTTYSWTLDATQTRFAAWTDSATSVTTTNHYSDDSDSPAWSSSGSSWTRDETGLDDDLAATTTSAGVTTLELTDLHGDVLATVLPSSDSAPAATYTYTEFGAAETTGSTPGEYGYLGGEQRSDQALGGDLLMGQRAYSPALGRFAQVDSVAGGSANAYDYVDQNPTNRVDLAGTCWSWISWLCNSIKRHEETLIQLAVGTFIGGMCAGVASFFYMEWLDPYCGYIGGATGGAIAAAWFRQPNTRFWGPVIGGAFWGALGGGITGKWLMRFGPTKWLLEKLFYLVLGRIIWFLSRA